MATQGPVLAEKIDIFGKIIIIYRGKGCGAPLAAIGNNPNMASWDWPNLET
jgi:hypothetical protein